MDVIRQLEDSGPSAVVLFSLFEEQIRHEIAALEYFVTRGTDSCSEALSYLPDIGTYDVGPGQYLELIRKATDAVDIPVIASLNGVTEHGWVDFARDLAEAGASGIELNVYYIPTELNRTGIEVEQQSSAQVPHGRRRRRQSTSAVLQQGPGFFARTLADMTAWLEEKGYASVGQLRGCMSGDPCRPRHTRTRIQRNISQAAEIFPG